MPILFVGALFIGTTRPCPWVVVVLWLRASRSLMICAYRGFVHRVHSWFAPIVAYVFCTPFYALVGPLPCNRASLYGLRHCSPHVRKNPIVVLLLVPAHGSRVVCARTTGRPAFKTGPSLATLYHHLVHSSLFSPFSLSKLLLKPSCNHPPRMAGV
jgi:hypothetical protein